MDIKMLPHHIGLFTHYFQLSPDDREGCIHESCEGYGEEFTSNYRRIFESLLNNRKVNVEIVLSVPDSICLDNDPHCSKCLCGGAPWADHERAIYDEPYRAYIEATAKSTEVGWLLFYYPGLSPKKITQEEFLRAIDMAGENIRMCYRMARTIPFQQPYFTPDSLTYLGNYTKMLQTYFPMALKYENSNLCREMGRGDGDPSIEKMERVKSKYSYMFSDDSSKIYQGALSEMSGK